MRKHSIKLALSAILVVGVVGCSDKDSSKGSQKAEAKKVEKVVVKKEVKLLSKEDRKKAVTKKFADLSKFGLELKEDGGKYILIVKDDKKATQLLLELVNQQALDVKSREPIEKLVKGAKFGVEIDWDKYAQNKEDSVFVYYLGKGDESAEFKKFLDSKGLGSYLTFNNKDELKVAKLKNIDTTFGKDKKASHLVYKGARLDIEKYAHSYKEPRKYKLDFGNFIIKTVDENTEITFSNSVCNADQPNAYLGKFICKFGDMTVKDKRLDATFVMKNITLDSNTVANGDKINSKGKLAIEDISFSGKEAPSRKNKTEMTFKNFVLSIDSKNIDKNIVDKMYALTDSKLSSDELIKKIYALSAEYLSCGSDSKGILSLEKFEAKDGKGSVLSSDNYKANFSAFLGKVINFNWNSNTQKTKIVSTKVGKEVDLELNNDKFGYAIKDLYNFFPDMIKAMPTNKTGDINETVFKEIGAKVVNNGVKFKLGVVGFDSLKLNSPALKLDLGKLSIDLNTQLAKNSVDISSPASQMMLMQSLSGDGKIELMKKDLNTIVKLLPPQVGMMLAAFAKESGDNVVYEIKLEGGHLTINGKKLM